MPHNLRLPSKQGREETPAPSFIFLYHKVILFPIKKKKKLNKNITTVNLYGN